MEQEGTQQIYGPGLKSPRRVIPGISGGGATDGSLSEGRGHYLVGFLSGAGSGD